MTQPCRTSMMIESLIQHMDQIEGNEKHSLIGLPDIVGTLISDREKRNVPEYAGTPAGRLKYLMEEQGLKSGDMPEYRLP